jgi:hypothetical protein
MTQSVLQVPSEEGSSSSLEAGGLAGGVKKCGRKALTERSLEDISDHEAHLSFLDNLSLLEEELLFEADDCSPRGDIKGGQSMGCSTCGVG